MVTVDAPTAGARWRDAVNRLAVPVRLDARRVPSAVRHPRWWLAHLRDEPLSFASVDQASGSMAEVFASVFDAGMTLDDLAWVRSQWSGPLVVKGVQCAADAVAAVDVGADAVTLSVHGGRQLDRAAAPLDHLVETVQASPVGPRCTSTRGSGRAPTSSRRSHSGPTSRGSGAPTCTG